MTRGEILPNLRERVSSAYSDISARMHGPVLSKSLGRSSIGTNPGWGAMKRLIVIGAALLTLTGVSAVTATAGSASVCEPDGTGCTKAGAYPANAVINSDYGGRFKVVWTKSVVQPYSSGVPLYWTAYVTYTNISSLNHSLDCSTPDVSGDAEHMSGGSGDDGGPGTGPVMDPGPDEVANGAQPLTLEYQRRQRPPYSRDVQQPHRTASTAPGRYRL